MTADAVNANRQFVDPPLEIGDEELLPVSLQLTGTQLESEALVEQMIDGFFGVRMAGNGAMHDNVHVANLVHAHVLAERVLAPDAVIAGKGHLAMNKVIDSDTPSQPTTSPGGGDDSAAGAQPAGAAETVAVAESSDDASKQG